MPIRRERKAPSSPVKVDGGPVESRPRPIPIRIAYVGGGSRGWAHDLMHELALGRHFEGEVRLYDIDRPMAKLNETYGNWLQTHPDAVSRWKYRAVPTLRAALKGADFVFLSIQPGPIEHMKVDLEEPMKVGIYQPVGDTVGPGGCIRALRALRDYRVFGEAVAEHAPRAVVLNFTNPMTVCTRGLYRAWPGIRAYGCCHEVFNTQRMLGRVYAAMTGEPEPSREEVRVNILGLNHFTWIDRAECRGQDLLALLRDYLDRPGVIRRCTRKEVEAKGWFASFHQVAYELFRRFGVLGAAGDRHLAEFVPWFLTSADSCYRWGFHLTPYSYRIDRHRRAPREFRRQMRTGRFPALKASGEEYIRQMLGLVGRALVRTNVNLPNRGQMRNVPLDAVVETNAVFSEGAVEPVASGALPDIVNTLVLRQVANQEALVEAVFTEDEDLAFQAFVNDPLVRLPLDDAWRLFRTMLRKTRFEFGRQ